MSETTISAADSRFESTAWSVVRQAADSDPAIAREGLAELCRQYWYPIYTYIRRRTDANEAEDLTQGFFTHLLAAPIVSSADPAQGRFRAYLLACCKNFLSSERERAQAQKRGGGARTFQGASPVPFDGREAEGRYELEPTDPRTPERHFERQWALALLAGALHDVEEECHRHQQGALFARLRPMLAASSEDTAKYGEIAAALGLTEAAVKKAAQRLRERYGSLLRQRIAATLVRPDQLAEEIRDLFVALES